MDGSVGVKWADRSCGQGAVAFCAAAVVPVVFVVVSASRPDSLRSSIQPAAAPRSSHTNAHFTAAAQRGPGSWKAEPLQW